MSIIDQQLQAEGPYHLGQCFSLVDIILCYWAEYVNFGDELAPYPALRRYKELVSSRPLLRLIFDELIECRVEYTRKQSDGGGVK